jgi:hypothetical protein
MLTWNERLNLELRNRGNDDVRLLLKEIDRLTELLEEIEEEIDRLTELLEDNHVDAEEEE